MKFPGTPCKKKSNSVEDLLREGPVPNRGRTRRKLSDEFSEDNASSTPLRGAPVLRRVRRSLSAGRRFSLGCSVEGAPMRDSVLPETIIAGYGRYNSPFDGGRFRSQSTTCEVDLDVTPVCYVSALSTADLSNLTDISLTLDSFNLSRSTTGLQITTHNRSRHHEHSYNSIKQNNSQVAKGSSIKKKIMTSVRTATDTLANKRSASLFSLSSNDVTPTSYTSYMEDSGHLQHGFVSADQHPDFRPDSNIHPRNNMNEVATDSKVRKDITRRYSSFDPRSILQNIGKKSADPDPAVRAASSISSQRSAKKRRASDINIREIFESAKRYSRREKESKIAEDVYDIPKLKDLPSCKKNSKTFLTASHKTQVNSLQEILKRKSSILHFRAFLKTEFSDENLDFWIECETYKEQKISKQRKVAGKIYEKYVKIGAPREVNLDFLTRKKIKSNIENPSSKTFEIAQCKIFRLMENDSFKRYLNTLKTDETEEKRQKSKECKRKISL